MAIPDIAQREGEEAAAEAAERRKAAGAPPPVNRVNPKDVIQPGTAEDQWVQIQLNKGVSQKGLVRRGKTHNNRPVNEYRSGEYVGPNGRRLDYKGRTTGQVEALLRSEYKRQFGQTETAKGINSEIQRADIIGGNLSSPVSRPATGTPTRTSGPSSRITPDPTDAPPPASGAADEKIETTTAAKTKDNPGGLMPASTTAPPLNPDAGTAAPSGGSPAVARPKPPPIKNADLSKPAAKGQELVGVGWSEDGKTRVPKYKPVEEVYGTPKTTSTMERPDQPAAPAVAPVMRRFDTQTQTPQQQRDDYQRTQQRPTPTPVSRPDMRGPASQPSAPYVSPGDRFNQEARDKSAADAETFRKSLEPKDPTMSTAKPGDPDYGKKLSQGEMSAVNRGLGGSGATGADGSYQKGDVGPGGGRVIATRPGGATAAPVKKPDQMRFARGRR
jgi:hypothetical protein